MSERMSIEIEGSSFNVAAPPDRVKYWTHVRSGRWERSTFMVLGRFLRPNMRYIDIGTWIGPTILFAATRGAQVVGFEPDPVARLELEANIAVNSPEIQRRINIVPAAISTKSGVSRLYSDNFGVSMSRFNPDWERKDGMVHLTKSVDCSTINVTEAAESYRFHEAALVKIDVEGHEYDFVPALADHLKGRIPVHLSLHPNAIGNSEPTPDAKKAERIQKTVRILDAFGSCKVEICEETEIVPISRSQLDARLHQRGGLWGPLLFTPQ
jgi:FkbM family methyltransferase